LIVFQREPFAIQVEDENPRDLQEQIDAKTLVPPEK
jgi:hypothetical protein